MAEIRDSNCDLVCTQELDHASDFYIEQLETLGYSTIHKPRPCPIRTLEGLGISFKRQTLELIASEFIDLSVLSEIR
jgi:mRNA deadenylase 3'-5' endonuclease subunit Ccr4